MVPTATPAADGTWRRRDEPPWYDPKLFINMCKREGFSNIFESAFSPLDRAFIDLPTIRNLFAHRQMETERAACQIANYHGLPSMKHPSVILLARLPGKVRPLLADWISWMSFTIQFLCH